MDQSRDSASRAPVLAMARLPPPLPPPPSSPALAALARPLEKDGFGAIGMHPALRPSQHTFLHSTEPISLPEPARADTGSTMSTLPSATTTPWMVPLLRLNTRVVRRRVDGGTEWKPKREHWFTMITLSFVSFVVSLDATILVTALPEISHALHGSAAEAFWTGTSYLLTSAVFQPVIAKAAYCFGRRRLLIVSIVLFSFGTALCAVAHDFAVMLVGRCVQGIGGGGIIALTQVIFCDMVPLRQRPQYFSMVLGAWSVGSIIGPVVGGSLVETASWRWCFYINFPFCGVGLAAATLFVRSDGEGDDIDDYYTSGTFTKRVQRMDWLGALLFVAGMTSLLVGISWGGTQHPWASAATLVPVVAGVLTTAVFVAWQVHVQPQSLLPTTLFYNVSSVAAFYCALVNGLILFTALYYIPFYLLSVRGLSPVRAGIDLFPAVFLLIPGSVIVAVLTSRFGRFRWAVWLGWGVTVVACGLFVLFDEDAGGAVIALALAVFGVGSGMVLTGVNVATQAISKVEDREMAACMFTFMRSLGMAVGVALSGAIFQNAMSKSLSAAGLPVGIARESERFIFVLRELDAADPRKAIVLASYTQGFRAVFIAMTAMSVSALAASALIKRFSMDAVPRVG